MTTETVAPSARTERASCEEMSLRDALTRALFEHGLPTLLIGAACLLLCAGILRGAIPDAALLAWLAAGLTVVVARVPLVLAARRLPDERLPYRTNLVLVGGAGAVWGTLALFWSPSLDTAEHLVLIIFPMSLSVGAVSSYGCRPGTFFAFALPAQLPLVAMLLLSGDPAYVPLAAPALLFVGGQALLALRYHRQLRETLTLRLGNEALVRDLSARNEALESARDEARCASVAKSEFLARMSHELRTPMNGVLGVAELLGTTALDARQRQLLTTLWESGRTMLGLLDRLLDISSVESEELVLETRDYAPRELLEAAIEHERAAAEARSLALRWSVDSCVPALVHGDPERLGQIVHHLVDNAVRFTERGAVRVRLTLESDEGGTARLVLSVADSGVGIPPEQLESVFEPFRQGDGSSTRLVGGTGVGLALVRGIANLAGGSVRVASTLGAGSTFVVEMPFVPAASPEPSRAIVSTVSPDVDLGEATAGESTRGASVLVAEDNPVNRMLVEAMLEELGCAVRCVENGAEALEALDAERFDIVLMDCQMPVLDGLEATRAARARDHRLPIVAVTANAMEGDRARCLEAGMNDYLSKPFTGAALGAIVERWLGAARTLAA